MEDSRTNPQPAEPPGHDGTPRDDAPGAWPPVPAAHGDESSAPWPPREDLDEVPPAEAWPPPAAPAPGQPVAGPVSGPPVSGPAASGRPVPGQPAPGAQAGDAEANPWAPFPASDAAPADWPAFAAEQTNGNGNGHAGNGHAGNGNGHVTNAAWQTAPPPSAEPPARTGDGWPPIPERPEVDPFGPTTPGGGPAAEWPQFAPATHDPDEPYDFRAAVNDQPTDFQPPAAGYPTAQQPAPGQAAPQAQYPQQPGHTGQFPTVQPDQSGQFPAPTPDQTGQFPAPPREPTGQYPTVRPEQTGQFPAPDQTGQYPTPQGQHQPPPDPYQTPQYQTPQYQAPQYQAQPQRPHDPLPGSDHAPTADDFAQRRAARPTDPVANQGMRKAMRVGSFGLIKMGPGRKEEEARHAVEMVRRNFGGLRQITVINPKGGAGKTVAVLMVAMTFGQKRGGYVLAWDNNETQGTLGMRAAQDFHNRTVRDLLRDLAHFRGPTGRVGDLSQYVRAQGEAMFDVLASDESATAGEMLTSQAFREIRDVVSRFYKLIVVDTGNNVRAANWQSAIDATDQLVVCMSARNDSAETAARALDHLEQTGRHDLVRRAVTVVSMPAHRKDLDLPAVQRHFSARTRAVLLAPYEKLLDSGEPIRYAGLTQSSRDAWLKIAAAVAEGL
ncbi:MAG TPA: chromosome partitioning protein [Actinocatenispora sp.]